jgi:hypothetical protein
MPDLKKRLGRRQMTDVRDHGFALGIPVRLPDINSKTWTPGPSSPWDQGFTSQCVAYSTNQYLAASPYRNAVPPKQAGVTRESWLNHFYKECQKIDEWPGENYDGTSVRAAMKLLLQWGYITEYRWAFDVPTVLNYVLTTGPMVVGTDWTVPMFDPMTDKKYKSFIQVSPGGTYDVAGGHAYTLIGANRTKVCPDGTKGAFRILNSWGKSWGETGRAWISFREFGILLANQGEAAVAKEILKM